MTPLRQRMLEDMQLRGLSSRTQETYLTAVRQLALHYDISPDRLTEEQIRQYFLFLRNIKHLAPNSINVALGITIAAVPFPHLIYHLVLTYSNVEAIQICFSESFEVLAEGLEACLWQIGGSPHGHRTDNLSAAVVRIDVSERIYTDRYLSLMSHHSMQPSTNQPGEAHENGDVEQAHHRFKQAVDQALRLHGSRDFPSREAYLRFLHTLVRRRNASRQPRWDEERTLLRPLPSRPLDPTQEIHVTVSRFATIRVLRNIYSVPSQLIGQRVLVRVRAEELLIYHGSAHLHTIPRLRGAGHHQIDYRHIISSLVRKPGAFAQYRYRDDLFPSLLFRTAYDQLCDKLPQRASQHYVRILHLAATTSEVDVEAALSLRVLLRQVAFALRGPCCAPAVPSQVEPKRARSWLANGRFRACSSDYSLKAREAVNSRP